MSSHDFTKLLESGEYAPAKSSDGTAIFTEFGILGGYNLDDLVVYEHIDGQGWNDERPWMIIKISEVNDQDSCIFYHPTDLSAWLESMRVRNVMVPTIVGSYLNGEYIDEDTHDEIEAAYDAYKEAKINGTTNWSEVKSNMEKIPLKVDVAMYFQVLHRDLNEFIASHYGRKFDFVESLDIIPGHVYLYKIRKGELDEDQKQRLELFKTTDHTHKYLTFTLLTDLCNSDVIPEGDYLITT